MYLVYILKEWKWKIKILLGNLFYFPNQLHLGTWKHICERTIGRESLVHFTSSRGKEQIICTIVVLQFQADGMWGLETFFATTCQGNRILSLNGVKSPSMGWWLRGFIYTMVVFELISLEIQPTTIGMNPLSSFVCFTSVFVSLHSYAQRWILEVGTGRLSTSMCVPVCMSSIFMVIPQAYMDPQLYIGS